MHDWLREALTHLPLLHGGVRAVAERCPTPNDAYQLFDLPELVAWVALARSVGDNRTEEYANALLRTVAEQAQTPAPESATAVERACHWWRRGAAFSALCELGTMADHWEPLDTRAIARGHEHVFLALQAGESLQGVHLLTGSNTAEASVLCQTLRTKLSDFAGSWGTPPPDVELRRRHARAVGDSARKQFGLLRNDEEDEPATLHSWSDVLAIAGVTDAPDLPLETLLTQLEGVRDILLVRSADMLARSDGASVQALGAALDSVLGPSLDDALTHADHALERVRSEDGARALAPSKARWMLAGAACALRAALVQAEGIAHGQHTVQRSLALVRWAAETGERVEVWLGGQRDEELQRGVQRALRSPVHDRTTLRP
ncbi:MAG: hypothetical protein Q8Q09_06600 [Deltaproteobacteria bacterium]|nr:hypothetical protein [Deltaproteobacteria bacterium]